VATASASNFPSLTNGSAENSVTLEKWVRPPRSSIVASGPPLNATVITLIRRRG